ncbi:MAG: M1 family metallopeptidase [Acidobacteriota bacterium]
MVRVPFAARCARLLVLATVAALSSGIGPATPAAPAQEPRAEGEASQTVVEPLPPEPDATTGAADEEDYERLLEWRYAAQGVPVEGVTIQRDAATWTLESGTVRLAEPTSGGAVTGFVFEGEGRFRLEVPDPVEREQLHRFTRGAAHEVLDATFSKLVLRVPGGAGELVGVSAEGPYDRNGLAADRHEHWLEHRSLDADARVVAGLLTPGSDYLLADMDTGEHGWLTVELEPWRREELELRRFKNGFTESWVSLDRAEDRKPSGRPSLTRRDTIRVHHADIAADLTKAGRGAPVGITEAHPRIGEFTVDLEVEALVSGPRVLRLSLHPRAEVHAVRVDGREAPFLRHHIGGRGFGIDSEIHDDDLLVLLEEPLASGEEHTVSVDYRMEVHNYVSGRSWYPEEAQSYLEDKHTGTFDLTLPERIEVRPMGRREGEPVIEKRTRRERWVVERPTFMLSFTYADRPFEYDLEVEGAPRIEVFGPGMGKEAKFHNVAADVANSTRFFQDLFDLPLGTDLFRVSSIVGGHGQAFDGFLHMSEGSFHLERPGASELFRAHEMAHEWWGHRVVWATYRDQWLSEAFAEYSAMMYVEATMEDGEKWFDEILFAYREALQGSIKAGFSKFQRAGIVPLNPNLREQVGPIAVGYRAATADAPGGYAAQAYLRGPWVLHMLRVMLRNLTKSDEMFVKVLSDFLERYDGKAATTQDFIDSLTDTAPGDWQWFFDQWVYGTAIPTYSWDWDVERGEEGQDVLALTVRQEGVPEGFRMPVPVKVNFGRGQEGQAVVLIDEPEETFRLPMPARPRNVELNPDHAVLAKVDRL